MKMIKQAVMMKCGHTAQGKINDKDPVCVICYDIADGATEVASTPDLENRKAECWICAAETESDLELPFFEYRPAYSRDWFYCGCRGWD